MAPTLADIRKQLLAEKLSANRQRWLARLFVARLPKSLQEVLTHARVIVAPKSCAIAIHNQPDERRVGNEFQRGPSFFLGKFRDPQQVFDVISSLSGRADSATGYFQPNGFFPIEALPMGPGDLPLFEVEFGWARRHMIELYEHAGQACSLTTKGGDAGIIINVVCGYSDRDADEEVFELSCWGFDSPGAITAESAPPSG